MNLFVLHRNPRTAASYMCDKHIGKMLVEYAQILYTVLQHHWKQTMPDVQLPDGSFSKPYRVTHKSHPIVLWAAACETHALWIVDHAQMLGHRFGEYSTNKTVHASQHHITAIGDYMSCHAGRLMPHPLSLKQFLKKYADTHPNLADKTSPLDPPDLCAYGVVCADPPDDTPNVKVYYRGELSVVASYRRFYAYKAKFKFPMEWMRSTIVPADLAVWFTTYCPKMPLLLNERKKRKLETIER